MSNYPIQKTEAQWREQLGEAHYKILREKGTERPFTGSYNLTFEDGTYIKDTTLGMERTEIVCSNCGGHLGHVFDDGPTSTGQRYCVNSLSVDFEK